MRNFLWSQDNSFRKGRAKVSWKSICTPKYEGGLGIRRIGDFNKALMANHVWGILTKRKSLWVEWVHDYKLKGKSFWMVRVPTNCCWSWRKILQLRPIIRNYIWTSLGDGSSTSAWYDTWSALGPLGNFLSPRTITNARFRLDSSVAEINIEGVWQWPTAWRDLYPVLNQLDPIQPIVSKKDSVKWRDGDAMRDVSASCIWESLRYSVTEVNWTEIVWFAQCIPKHSFLMWLIMRNKLLTQDIILQWDISRRKNMNMLCCLLCYQNHDSHKHLFFECKYSTQVWNMVRVKAGMDNIGSKWEDIVARLQLNRHSKSVNDYVSRLVVAASAYLIWQERNARIFKNQMRPPEKIYDLIIETVRYKIMGVKLKRNDRVRRLLGEWGIPDATTNGDGD
ncbi:putative reverse transcriptase zinc-binding domain-containing protein [Helianthus annuus]|nr:putative reverse transcriptase zinc-binding domain-containing protein [Helianthus annuus]